MKRERRRKQTEKKIHNKQFGLVSVLCLLVLIKSMKKTLAETLK